MQASTKEIVAKVAAVTIFVNGCVVFVASFLTEREEWAADLPIVILLATALTVGVSWSLARQVKKSHALTQELQRVLNRDRLTNVASRDLFFSEVERRSNMQGVILMVDLDRFKAINDKHGHQIGDQVIRDVAVQLSGNIRGEDLICRFGGAQFLIFLNRQDETTGASIGERLRGVIEKRLTPIGKGETVNVTVSLGAARMDNAGELDQAIGLAGDALLSAKEGGRNRLVVSWRDVETESFSDAA
ncbi:GGDEF domain-containing protein [Shimia haliotis]|uniref:diguanylate cyclase n=1 Tax=Shimia haliotis TaxID=1280847 RepID=A0A1I4CNP7_9RHOB|nr:GGDEF domain-containing protein [Shimia haliotis]SFK81897.1 diguanylate cyclase (GGDEF) domain-containing protein [Shimia haliotis]